MRTRRAIAVLGVAALGASIATTAVADDGELVRKSISHVGQDTTAGIEENEHAFISYMKFYTHAQAANGTVAPVVYNNVDGELVEEREFVKPLVAVYINGLVEGVEEAGGFVGHGLRDAYGAVSLDDGMTWKSTNLSESADKSSSDVVRNDIPLFAGTDYAYPGDVSNIFHAVAGPNVVVAWQSRYCSQGEANYSLDSSDKGLARRAAVAEYLGIVLGTASADDLYLIDMFGVAGSQGSIDYNEDKWEANAPVGVVPFNCLWTARGQLVDGDDPRTEDVIEESFMRWFNTERLTSGRRDVNRIEVMGVEGAGFAITWQEDPEGLRPGQGEGPGEGWSGAIANNQTDVWYSYIDWEDFDIVQDPADDAGTTAMTLADYEADAATADVTQKPKPFVPFAMPSRLTDNGKCNVDNPNPYCYGSALAAINPEVPTTTDGIALNPLDYGLKDYCESIITIETGRHTGENEVCVTEDGLPLLGNTAATRPRLNLYGYASSGKDKDPIDSAFALVVTEEDKGLGKFGFKVDENGVLDYTDPCTPVDKEDDPNYDPACVGFDEGKNMWYHTFSMSLTDPAVGPKVRGTSTNADGLLSNLVSHGNMLNQPEVNWETGDLYGYASTEYMWDFSQNLDETATGVENYEIYNTEIARRGSLLAQDIAKATDNKTSKSRLIALPSWKQGVMNQGGPADVMSRRIVVPKGWQLKNNGNPYAFRNMECAEWMWNPNDKKNDGVNPQYPGGVCIAPALNFSATTPESCIISGDETATDVPCPTVTTDGVGDTNPVLLGKDVEPNNTKVLEWHQYPENTDDQSWHNPLDVAKGHRGFLDGDFVMMLYAWSPNWKLNTTGRDRYELYIRRSFDGGKSFTTLPANFTGSDGSKYTGDGTTTCETFRSTETGTGDVVEPQECTTYDAGAFEQARNVTQLKSMKFTILDPRYAISGSPYGKSVTADPFGLGLPGYTTPSGDEEDLFNPSRYFIVYETGDNNTTEFGEAEPLDLFYSRAVNFGDDYVVWDETAEGGDNDGLGGCYPSDPHGDEDVVAPVLGSGFCNEWDQLEQGLPGLESSESSLAANPGGQFLYSAWTQLLLDDATGDVTESDAMSRRVWWLDDFIGSDAWVFGQGSATATLQRSQEVMVLDN